VGILFQKEMLCVGDMVVIARTEEDNFFKIRIICIHIVYFRMIYQGQVYQKIVLL